MRSIRGLPPVLRGAFFGGLLCAVLDLVVLSVALGSALPGLLGPSLRPLSPSWHALVTGQSLSEIALACACVVTAYRLRVRQTASQSSLVQSWQRQLRTIGFLAALPLITLGLALILPETPLEHVVLGGIIYLAAVVQLVGWVWAVAVHAS